MDLRDLLARLAISDPLDRLAIPARLGRRVLRVSKAFRVKLGLVSTIAARSRRLRNFRLTLLKATCGLWVIVTMTPPRLMVTFGIPL